MKQVFAAACELVAKVPVRRPHIRARHAGLGSGPLIGKHEVDAGVSHRVHWRGAGQARDRRPGFGGIIAEQGIAPTAAEGAPVSARYVARSREIAARRLGEEIVVMSARDSTLFSLNVVAAVIGRRSIA